MGIRHFLTLNDISPTELSTIIQRAITLKTERAAGVLHKSCASKVLGMIFEKSSTRTRVSFEAGIAQLGGHGLFLSSNDTQLGRGEPIEDTARVISSMVDILMVRTHKHDIVETFAEYSKVPVINALTDSYHPCQLLADIQTYTEHRGNPQGKTVTWIGDGNNMCQSYIKAARLCDFTLNIVCPEGYEPDETLLAENSDRINQFTSPIEGIIHSDWVVTDTWTSMGQEKEKQQRLNAFNHFQVTEELMAQANDGAVFMHCLPAYRGMEINDTIMDSPYSVVWDEAENRLHAQKALMEFLLGKL
ncbi:ornithine carbamoyltransferase [Candidatus Endobugula sertula]|uniref:Ornithine carbamoyltransferase n=1 Tax=Candidatus Endobugula sertula TaxID=62101 RepID=A0A1D2QU30_9GAMM|nr:ornithine carbamoyltransferase [Candidatus Endobugula sertula]